jgi:Ca-activated chloride channel family protein
MNIWQHVLITIIITSFNSYASPLGEPETQPTMLFAFRPATNERIILPLESTDVELEVTGGINTATVTQTFVNHTSHTLEAIYTFPLPAKATVTDMELRVGDRVIRSVVQEREEAKKTYETAKSEGKKTALIEQERPNIFTTSVANFGPGERVSIRLQYMEALLYQKGHYSITFPMVVGQRYLPPEWQQQEDGSYTLQPPDEDMEKLNPPLLPMTFPEQANLSLRVKIHGIPLREILSTTHAIDVEEPAAEHDPYLVTLARGMVVPNADLNLKLFLKETTSPSVSFLESIEHDQRYGLLTIFPPTTEQREGPPPPRDVVFLIDTSGSMSGDSIGQAQTGLKKCMEMLRPQDRFNIIRFASKYSSFAPNFRSVTPQKINQAHSFIDTLNASGGTEMHPALRHALSLQPETGHLKLVIFLTDGNVGNEDDLMRLLENELGRSRMFTFAIGSAPNEHLIRTMAEQGRGQARFIRSHEDIGKEMADFFRTLETPVLTDITLSWQDADGEKRDLLGSYPAPCPDVFYHRPVQVLVASKTSFSGRVNIEGIVNGKSVTYPFELPPSNTSHPAIGNLFGNAMIQDQMLDFIRTETPVTREEIKQIIIATALKHQLVTKFTSRVAVEEQQTVQADGSLETVNVKVPLPKGWNGTAFHATATLDPLWFLIGSVLFLLGILMHLYRKRAYA